MTLYADRAAASGTVDIDVDVRPLSPDRTLLITGSGRLFEIDRPAPELVRELSALAASPEQPPWPELASILRAADALIDTGTLPPPNPQHPVVLSRPLLADVVERLGYPADVRPLPAPDQIGSALADIADRPLLVLLDRFDPELLTAIDQARDSGGPWAPFHLDRKRAWMGPAIRPGHGPNYRDLLVRRRCAIQRADLAEAFLQPGAGEGMLPPPPRVLDWLIAFFLAEVDRWLSDGVAQPGVAQPGGSGGSGLIGAELEVDPSGPSIQPHPVLPLPDKGSADDQPVHPAGATVLRDERTGVIADLRVIKHHPSIPRELATVQAHVADMGRAYPWAPNTVCGGSVFGDVAAAEAAAIGESVERYCCNWVRPELLREASYAQLVDAGEHALDPDTLVLYSAEQYRAPGFPFVPFTHDLVVHWVRGHNLTKNQPCWVPASVAFVNWYIGPFVDAPPTNYPFYAGLAAGSSFDDAVRSGLEEIIERDATMLWWSNRAALPVLEPPPRLAALFDGAPAEHGQRAWLVHLENEFGVPVVAGVVENTQDQLLAIGFGARDDVETAALKAWAEALTLQEIARDLNEPDGRFWQAVRDGVKHQGFMKPWRADRAYLEDFRDDFRDVGDLECQMQVHLDPRAGDTVRPWTLAGEAMSMTDVPSLPSRSLNTYRRLVEDRGYQIIAVDLTTPDVARSGLRAVRVVVPGLVSNFCAAFPFNGKRRLQDAPVALGWRDAPLQESELNVFPLAHA